MKKLLLQLGFKKQGFFNSVYVLKTNYGLIEITILGSWMAIYSEFRQMYEGFIDLQSIDLKQFENYFKIIVK
jgi:hypothetical protein